MGASIFEDGGITRRRLLQGMAIGGGMILVANGCRTATRGSADQSPVAETNLGNVRGVLVNGVSIFAGIPYGADTAGAWRFMPPAKAASWAGIRDATTPGTLSPQGVVPAAAGLRPNAGPDSFFAQFAAYKQGKDGPNRFEQAQSKQGEDCLVLNVATGGLKGKRPVLVYIHGGGYIVGDGMLALGADKWVQEQDIVVVGINHRLGFLGYTYLGEISEQVRGFRQRGATGPDPGAGVGARQHCELWRGSGQRDGLRRVGRRRQDQYPDGHAQSHRPVSQGHRRKRLHAERGHQRAGHSARPGFAERVGTERGASRRTAEYAD